MNRQAAAAASIVIALGGAILAILGIRGCQQARLRNLDIPQLRDLAASSPADSRVHTELAKRLLTARQVDDAALEFAKAVELDPMSFPARLGLAQSMEQQGKFDRADTEASEALRLDKNSAAAHSVLARVLRQTGDQPAALDHSRLATTLDPRDASGWHEMAKCLQDAGDSAGALSCSIRAGELAPSNPAYQAALAGLYADRHQMPEALTHYDRSLKIDPANAETCAQAGAFLAANPPDVTATGRSEELLLRAIRLGTTRPADVWFSLGQLYLHSSRPSQAIEAFLRATSYGVQDERYFYGLANAYERAGDHLKSTSARKRFLQLSKRHARMEQLLAHLAREPQDSTSRLELARIYKAYGLGQMARRQYTLYLRQAPDDSAVAHEMATIATDQSAAPLSSPRGRN